MYNYLFHCSELRSVEKQWACFHKDDAKYYWNGIGPNKNGEIYNMALRIYYGRTPEDAIQNAGLGH